MSSDDMRAFTFGKTLVPILGSQTPSTKAKAQHARRVWARSVPAPREGASQTPNKDGVTTGNVHGVLSVDGGSQQGEKGLAQENARLAGTESGFEPRRTHSRSHWDVLVRGRKRRNAQMKKRRAETSKRYPRVLKPESAPAGTWLSVADVNSHQGSNDHGLLFQPLVNSACKKEVGFRS